MERKNWWLAAALLVCAPAFAEGAPGKGTSPPPLLGKDRDGEVVDLATMHGKVVIVTFWASWCGYCLKELPVLNALQEKAGDDWLRIVAVNVKDDAVNYRAMTRQMRDYRLTLTRDRNGQIAKGYAVEAYPNLWLIDRQGRVWGHHVGYGEDSLETIINEIQSLLQAEAPMPVGTSAQG
jgi:thiol-disulfide isomerase/thioredoxin